MTDFECSESVKMGLSDSDFEFEKQCPSIPSSDPLTVFCSTRQDSAHWNDQVWLFTYDGYTLQLPA